MLPEAYDPTLNGISVGVVGAGYWGRNLVRNFAQLGALKWVCDPDPTALRAAAQWQAQVRLTSRFDDLLEDADLSAVVIATPAVMHAGQATAAIRAGKHVFVEKPIALDYQTGSELVKLARERHAVLMVGHVLEYHPGVVRLKELVQAGDLGSLRYLYSNRLNLGRVRQEENILWSFAPHDISVICSLVGQGPESVGGWGGTYLQEGIADVTVTNLRFAVGIDAHVFVSWLHPSKEQKLVVVGDRKMAVFEDTAVDAKLRVFDKGIEWNNGRPVPRNAEEHALPLPDREPLREECEHFLRCIVGGEEPRTGGDNALLVLAVLQAAQLSLERGGTPVRPADVVRVS